MGSGPTRAATLMVAAVVASGCGDGPDRATQPTRPSVPTTSVAAGPRRLASDARLVLLDRRSGGLHVVAGPTGIAADPSWSPDGRRLVYAQACTGCPTALALVSPAGGHPTLLPHGVGNDLRPAWRPDGQGLVFTRDDGNETQLVASAGDGRGRTELRFPEGSDDGAPSRDGRSIAFDVDVDEVRYIELARPDGTHARRLSPPTTLSDAQPAWSPDGRLIAFVRTTPSYHWSLWLMDADGHHQRQLAPASVGDDRDPTFAPDGRHVVFASSRRSPATGWRSLFEVGVDGRGLRQLTRGADDASPSFAPDGRRLVFSRRAIIGS